MTSDTAEKEWQRIREHYGDLAYEHPEMHRMMLDLLDTDDLDKALETATDELRTNFKRSVLGAYADGRLSQRQAIDALDLRDSAELLVALGDAGLPMPQPSAAEVHEQAETVARLFPKNRETKASEALEILSGAQAVPADDHELK
ncbi:hypothetical protein [Sinorhizobium fredii]|uniref:hypothetical protein n=1 Tax=Rhizobium fredii TaxID=380 RepID=UPI0004B2190A|nr:hypothetical protein [Sinorhizobium fredii]UTY48455.1 hypothetical protein EPK84_17585 [Sinorhizobium fredii]